MITYQPSTGGVSGGVSWGSISGSVTDQEDLASVLSSKIEGAHEHAGYAAAAHNHDLYYATTVHGHDYTGVYAEADHAHAGYSSATHNHDSAYSSATHNHDAAYSAIGHTHAGGAGFDPQTAPVFFTDFYSTAATANPPWTGAAISSGHIIQSSVSVDPNHPGAVVIGSSGLAAGGYRVTTSSDCMVLAGGETFKLVFRQFDVGTSVTVRFGFSDILTSAAPADGVYMQFVGGQWSGWTANNSSRSQTGSSFSPSSGVWYTGTITVSSNASSVTFDIKPSSGTTAWTDNLNANMPSSAGRYLGHGVLGTHGTSGVNNFIAFDYMELAQVSRSLVR